MPTTLAKKTTSPIPEAAEFNHRDDVASKVAETDRSFFSKTTNNGRLASRMNMMSIAKEPHLMASGGADIGDVWAMTPGSQMRDEDEFFHKPASSLSPETTKELDNIPKKGVLRKLSI